MVSGPDSGFRLRHALGCADAVWRMCVVNEIPAKAAAKTLGLYKSQVEGAVRLLKSLPQVPSPERLALVVQLDYGLDDDDIAEIFGRSARWAALVREHAAELRALEPIAPKLEWLEEGLQPDYPTPYEISLRALDERRQRPHEQQVHERVEITRLQWHGGQHAFLPVGA